MLCSLSLGKDTYLHFYKIPWILGEIGSRASSQEKKITLSLSDKHMESPQDEMVMQVVTGWSPGINSFVCFFWSCLFSFGGCPVFISTATPPPYNMEMLWEKLTQSLGSRGYGVWFQLKLIIKILPFDHSYWFTGGYETHIWPSNLLKRLAEGFWEMSILDFSGRASRSKLQNFSLYLYCSRYSSCGSYCQPYSVTMMGSQALELSLCNSRWNEEVERNMGLTDTSESQNQYSSEVVHLPPGLPFTVATESLIRLNKSEFNF